MDKTLKKILTYGGIFLTYRLYKLYQLGEGVIYKPVGVRFIRGASINDFVIRIKMELLNPTNTYLHMKGVDGKLIVKNQVVGAFASAPFTINAGLNYFNLDFKIDPQTTGVQLIQALIKRDVPVFVVEMNKRLPFISMTEKFAINPNTIPTTDSVLVK
jgi:hypothetical protein